MRTGAGDLSTKRRTVPALFPHTFGMNWPGMDPRPLEWEADDTGRLEGKWSFISRGGGEDDLSPGHYDQ
jgi:hypothetical protein